MTQPDYFVAVFEHDGDTGRDAGPVGPFVFESYLNESTREAAQSRLDSPSGRKCGAGRLARLDFDLQGEPSDPHIVIAGHDGAGVERGPLVWETTLAPTNSTRANANHHAARLERKYGACRIARLDFDFDNPKEKT